MSETEYIAMVCAANDLDDMVEWLIQSPEEAYYADRHVEAPPETLPKLAACAAGLALLVQWSRDIAGLGESGLFSTVPLLVVDQEWLDGLPEAPPPHVVLTLAKDQSLLDSPEVPGRVTDPNDSPFSELLTGPLESVRVSWLGPSEELESLGAWLVQLSGHGLA